MKKSGFFKWIALMLSVIMVLGLLTACSGGELEDKKTTAADNQTQGGETEKTTNAEEEESTNAEPIEITYPVSAEEAAAVGAISWYAKNEITLKNHIEKWEDSPFHAGFKNVTGFDIDWIFTASGANANTNWTMMVQDGTYPMVVTGSDLGFEELYEEEIIYNLKDYLPEYAPDYWAYINSDPEIYDAVTMEDGGICFFINGRDERIAYEEGVSIRKDWLDECGLSIPTTLEEWEVVLKAFKDKYGYALCAQKSMFKALVGIASGTGAYGGLRIDLYRDADGKIRCGQVQDEFKEVITILRRWDEMGLIDPDITTINKLALRTKCIAGQCGMIICDVNTTSRVQTEATDLNTQWVGVPYPTPDGKSDAIYGSYIPKVQTNTVTVITKNCPEDKLISVLKLLNFGYTEKGIQYYNFNQEGVAFYYDENGQEQWMDVVKNHSEGLVGGVNSYSPLNGIGAPSITTWHFAETRYGEVGQDVLSTWSKNVAFSQYDIPPIKYTVEEADRRADLITTLETYAEPMLTKMVFGEEPLDKWDEFVNELYKLGLNELLELEQTAYDRTYSK